MGRLVGVDTELVCRNLAPSRQYTRGLIVAGRVFLGDEAVREATRQMDPTRPLPVVENEREDYISRGVQKLIDTLDLLGEDGLAMEDVRCLDTDASTDGFADILLWRGVAHIVAVDVGYGQIAWRLRKDPRITVVERTNMRTLDPALVVLVPGLITGGLSFMSLTFVIPALVGAADPRVDFLLLVKPQFETGEEWLGSGEVVYGTSLHAWAIREVADCAAANGLSVAGATLSSLPGPVGSIEYLLYMRAGAVDSPCANVGAAVEQVVAQRPVGENMRS